MEIRSTGLIQRDNFTIDNSVGDGAYPSSFNFFCGDERYVALSLVGDLAKRNFA